MGKAEESMASAESSKAVGSAKKEGSGTEEVGIEGMAAAAASAAASPAAAATAAIEEGNVAGSHMGREDGNKSAASMRWARR